MFGLVFVLCIPFVSCSPVYISSSEWTFAFDLTLVKDDSELATCTKEEIVKWKIQFHECFMDRKYKDGGRNLNSIIDRIVEHAGVCTELSNRFRCRPDHDGLVSLLMIIIEQMKDYSQMYLEEIYKGRENIKDLKCVDNILSVKTYEICFEDVSLTSNRTETDLQNDVQSAIECVNTRNKGCSTEAMSTFNNIVRSILSLPQPLEIQGRGSRVLDAQSNNSGTESSSDTSTLEPTFLSSDSPSDYASSSLSPISSNDYASSSLSPFSSGDYASSSVSPISSGDNVSSSLSPPLSHDNSLLRRMGYFDYDSFSESYFPSLEDSFTSSAEYVSTESVLNGRQMPVEFEESPPEPQAEPEPTKRWYNYIIDPIVSAWNAVKSFFGNLFG